jgi:hypothetical protein
MSATDDIWAGVIKTAVETWHPEPTVPLDPSNPIMGKCSQCAIVLRGIMGYCCPVKNCPSGLGSTSSL